MNPTAAATTASATRNTSAALPLRRVVAGASAISRCGASSGMVIVIQVATGRSGKTGWRATQNLSSHCLNRTDLRKSPTQGFPDYIDLPAFCRQQLMRSGKSAALPPPGTGEPALQPHHVADHLGNRLVVLDRNFAVDLD